MVNVCALRCIGKENREKQFHKSEFRREKEREKGGDEMKDNKNEPMQMLKASMQKATFLKFLFLGVFKSVLQNHYCAAFGLMYLSVNAALCHYA